MTAKPTPHESLFPETEPNWAPTSPKERLIEAYALLLVEAPPVKSLTVEHCPDADERMRLARRLAAKDVPRLLTAVSRCKLEIGDAGRMAELKEALADWLRDFTEGCNNGGNPTETDIEELTGRTRQLLQKGQRP
jgi:hypothetical protein